MVVNQLLNVNLKWEDQYIFAQNAKEYSIDRRSKDYITATSKNMANTSSAKKKTKVIKRKTAVNRIRLGKYKSAISEIENAIKGGDKAKALKLFDRFQSQLMKVSKKGSIRRQTASRKISRTAKKLAGMK